MSGSDFAAAEYTQVISALATHAHYALRCDIAACALCFIAGAENVRPEPRVSLRGSRCLTLSVSQGLPEVTAVVLCIHIQQGPAKLQDSGDSSNVTRRWGHTLIALKSVRNMKTMYTRVAMMRPFSNILDSCLKGPIRNIVLQASHPKINVACWHQH